MACFEFVCCIIIIIMNTNSSGVIQHKSNNLKRIHDPVSNFYVNGYLSCKRIMIDQKIKREDKLTSSPQQSCDENNYVKLFVDVFYYIFIHFIDISKV